MSAIFYNNKQILSGQPSPFFSESNSMVRYGERWAQQKDITLRGQMTGCNYNVLINSQLNLISTLNKDFQTFEIRPQDGDSPTSIYSQQHCYVKNIDFQPSRYSNIVDYTVELGSYPANYFSGYAGVLEPSDEWDFQELDDKRVEITHTVSAKGINTSSSSSNALNNAKNFVLTRTGVAKYVAPAFVAMCHPTGFFLTEGPNEQIDRWNATYSVTEKYLVDTFYGKIPLFRYSSVMDCNKEAPTTTITINGTLEGGINITPLELRNAFKQRDIYALALSNYKDATSSTNLNPEPLTRSVSEDVEAGRVNFSYTYDNAQTPKIFFDYIPTIVKDQNDITTITINGTIKGRGNLKGRYTAVQALFPSINLFSIANTIYLQDSPTYPLNPKKENYSITQNKILGEIEISVSFTNKPIESTVFEDLDYTLNWVLPIKQVKPSPLVDICGTDYAVFYLGYWNRPEFNVNGAATRKCNTTETQTSFRNKIYNLVNLLSFQNFNLTNKYVEQNDISYRSNSLGQLEGVDFNITWSAKANNSANPSYSSISSLTPS